VVDIFVISYLATDRPTDGSGTYVRACVVVPAGALDALAPGAMTTPPRAPAGAVGGGTPLVRGRGSTSTGTGRSESSD
jgi:hypothetical protein